MNPSRRHFLHAATGLSAAATAQHFSAPLALGLAGMAALASQQAHAADASGYKALVCLYLAGGSDMHNWVVPIDATGYAQYTAARRELAWPSARLSPITVAGQAAGRRFAMPTDLAPLQRLYEAGQAAVVANVGTLDRPLTLAEAKAGVGVPAKLFSHNDQASTWQSLAPEGARSGWGGRLGDVLMSANQQPLFTAVSASGNAVFLSGSQVTQYQVGLNGPVTTRAVDASWVHGSTTAGAVLRRTLAAGGDTALQAEYARVSQRGITAEAMLRTALAASTVPAIPATAIASGTGATSTLDKDSLAQQLRMVARMIGAGQKMGMRRQVFMVSMGGFDSHNHQLRDQPNLMARVAHSTDYFMQAMASQGLANNVLLFTASDFGRTLSSNGDGSDHGWGSHHFVVGGGVKGRQILGRFPTTALGTADDIGSGRLLPSTSVTQMAAEMAGWMGLSATELPYVLPNVGQFAAGGLDFV
jgi:uncharacterized protein (DUF1501 family)